MPPSTDGNTATTQPTGTKPPRVYGLDGLRLFAAIGVMLYHYMVRTSIAWEPNDPIDVFGQGAKPVIYTALGPELFFVISGFVILMTAWGRSVPRVLASRLARLYPSYWIAVIITSVLLLGLWEDGKDITFKQALVNLTMFQRLFGMSHVDGVYWTLWTELRFYLIIVAFVAIGITRKRILTFSGLWPLAALGAGLLDWHYAKMFLVDGYAPLFAGGMLIYLIYRQGHAWAPWLLLVGNVALAVPQVVKSQMTTISANTAYTPSPTVLAIVVVACFALVAALTITPLRRIGGPWLVQLGLLTYPLYLTHEHWGWWFTSHVYPHLGAWPTLVLTCVVALLVAVLIYHGFEKHVGPRMRRGLERALTNLRPPRQLARELPAQEPLFGQTPLLREHMVIR